MSGAELVGLLVEQQIGIRRTAYDALEAGDLSAAGPSADPAVQSSG